MSIIVKVCYNWLYKIYKVFKMSSPILLSTINNSIGNKKNHITVQDLCNLLNGKEVLNDLDKYVIDTIQTEATKDELENFKNTYHIPSNKIKYVLSINPY